ncbi:MAG: Uxx-star family glutaredoxin-like (seleno)protein [Dehalococcoidales bacterium]|jgi:glutaredoxin-like YruB-family protein
MDVKIYTTPTCGYCQQAKIFLKQMGVAYKEVDVSVDRAAAQEMVDLTGQMGVPVIVVDGEAIIGFDRARLQELLSSGATAPKGQVHLGLKIADAAKSGLQPGALVGKVSPGLLGEKAGVKEGDIITGIAGTRVQGAADVEKVVAALRPGNIVAILFWRGNEQRKSEIVV